MINVFVQRTMARADLDTPLTSGSKGLRVDFVFTEDWDGLEKTAVFETNSFYKETTLMDSDSVIVPENIMAWADETLYIGVFGSSPDGKIVIPTVYANCGRIHRGANADISGAPLIPSQSEKLQGQIDEVEKRVDSLEKTSREETDPTVPAWAKAETKPSYTAEEVNAIPAPSYAEVGQTIVVSAVDEKGKPIAWRRVRNVGHEGEGVAAEVFNIDNVAIGAYSHAEGYGTVAQDDYSHTQGKCNALDPETQYAHVVGNGASKVDRSNAHTLEWDGTAWYAGDVYVGGTKRSEGERLAKVSEIPEIPEIPKDMFTATASEGQLFRVKSVDENGKPTELEPFDLFNAPEAGEIIPEVTLPLNDDGAVFFTEEVPAITLGATYLVTLNGEQYICVAQPVEMDGETLGLGLGNIGGFTGGENTGEPFVIVRVADELVAEVGFHALIWALGVESPITVSIIGIDMKIKDAFLPASAGAEIPATLPNPYKLTFSGAVNAEYDGSKAVEVVIPQGGGAVASVNGMTGEVRLDAEDVGAMPVDAAVVKTVNGSAPDASGNVTVETGGGGSSGGYAPKKLIYELVTTEQVDGITVTLTEEQRRKLENSNGYLFFMKLNKADTVVTSETTSGKVVVSANKWHKVTLDKASPTGNISYIGYAMSAFYVNTVANVADELWMPFVQQIVVQQENQSPSASYPNSALNANLSTGFTITPDYPIGSGSWVRIYAINTSA